jgi:hypothetical protein
MLCAGGSVAQGNGSSTALDGKNAKETVGEKSVGGTERERAVRVDILPGVPDKRSWTFAPPAVEESFTEPAFAWPLVPKKYSPRGIVVDRALPLLVRGEAEIALPAGEHRFLLRAMGAARFYVDDRLLLETKFRQPNADGHEAVPPLASDRDPQLRPLPPGHEGVVAKRTLDGQPHRFRLEAFYGDQHLRPELGELSVSVAAADGPFYLLAAKPSIPLSDAGWLTYLAEVRARDHDRAQAARLQAGAEEAAYWQRRHALAKQAWQAAHPAALRAGAAASDNPIDSLLAQQLAAAQVPLAPPLDDAAFLRRLSLDLIGVIPSRDEVEAYLAAPAAERRQQALDRLLKDRRWADGWMGYWQDVLAENPGILKPELNNSGPFRGWLYEAFEDNRPFDRVVTELVLMEGSVQAGGPAGFALATQNDAPYAAKAQILASAFLGVQLKCARCHDAPYHPYKQADTFQLAAFLAEGPQTLPKTSTVPRRSGGRQPAVKISLQPGDQLKAIWPFESLAPAELPAAMFRGVPTDRDRLAAILTSGRNERFAQVLVNRVWKRLIGWGFVEPVDDWNERPVVLPELLDRLAGEFVAHGYDLKYLTRRIVSSEYYRRSAVPAEKRKAGGSPGSAMVYPGPARRRMSAEQLVDSLFQAVDKPFRAEELNFDPEGRQRPGTFSNLGVPQRAWQFVSLSNERDRPALSLPVAQSILDVLVAFGWRESRQNPQSERDQQANVLQPLVLANGVVGARIATLSDDNSLTRLCVSDRSLSAIVRATFLQTLSRLPTAAEEARVTALLAEGFAARRTAQPAAVERENAPRTAVSWANHLSPQATKLKLEMERAAQAGDAPTAQLQADWRERMEDVVWALVNSPEFLFVP